MTIYETGENHNFIIWIGYSINLSPHEGEVHVVDAHDDGSDGKSCSFFNPLLCWLECRGQLEPRVGPLGLVHLLPLALPRQAPLALESHLKSVCEIFKNLSIYFPFHFTTLTPAVKIHVWKGFFFKNKWVGEPEYVCSAHGDAESATQGKWVEMVFSDEHHRHD